MHWTYTSRGGFWGFFFIYSIYLMRNVRNVSLLFFFFCFFLYWWALEQTGLLIFNLILTFVLLPCILYTVHVYSTYIAKLLIKIIKIFEIK